MPATDSTSRARLSAMRPAQIVGPLLFGTGVWAAAGHLTVQAVDSSVRVGVPASPLWILAGVACGLIVRSIRESPAFALPALLPALAWLPVSIPPIVLLWTGLLAWAPIGLVLVAGLVESWPERRASGSSHPLRQAGAAGALTLVALTATAWSLSPRIPSGDEPHYLMIAASLLRDGDLRIANNHARGDMVPFLAADARPHYIRPGADGEIYSIHAPGVAVAVLPAFAAFGYEGARAAIILMAALTGMLVWWIAWAATRTSEAAWFSWLAIVGSSTFLIQGVTVFPDGPGALAVAVTLAVLWTLPRRSVRPRFLLVVASVLLAALPWMHSRFAVIAAGMGTLVLLRTWTQPGLSMSTRTRHTMAFLLAPAVAATAWFGFFVWLYGTPNPSAPYGPNPEVNASYIPGGLAGLLFDQQFGLLMFSPILLAAAVGSRHMAGASWTVFWGPVLVAGAYLAASATYWMWWAGVPAPPARLAAAVLPVLAAPVATAYAGASRWGRTVVLGLLALSLGISTVLIGVERGALAWSTRDGYSVLLGWLESSADLFRGWPSFFWALIPGDVRSESTFLLHVAVWLVVGAAAAAAWRLARPQAAWTRHTRTLLLPLALMAAVQAGWRVTGSTGIDATAAQLRLLSTSTESVVSLSPGTVRRRPHEDLDLAIRVFDRRQRIPTILPTLTSLPPGTYAVDIQTRRPQTGRINVTLGRSRQAVATLPVEGRSRQTVYLDLPAGADRLSLSLDTPLAEVVDTLTLRPRLAPEPDGPLARAMLDVPRGRFFFQDDGVFVEPDGFWVRGGQHSESLLIPVDGEAMSLKVANGPVLNAVTVRVGSAAREFELSPGEEVQLPLPGGRQPLHLTISPTNGFRPSDDGTSADERYLGVRVSLE